MKGFLMKNKKWFGQVLMGATLVGILLIGSGCAFMDKHITLDSKLYADNLPSLRNQNIVVNVLLPKDERRKKANFIGYVRNGYRMHTADVLLNKPVVEWVQDVIVANLKKAGINAQASGKRRERRNGIFIEVRVCVLESDIEAKFFTIEFISRVNMTVTSKIEDRIFLNELCTGNGVESHVLWGSTDGYRVATEKGMKQAVSNMMPALIRGIERSAKKLAKTKNLSNSGDKIQSGNKTIPKKQAPTNKKPVSQDGVLPDFLK
jgi:hypothetical protein